MNKLDIDRELVKGKTTKKKKTIEGPIMSFKPSNLVVTFLSGIRCTNC